MLGNLGQLLIFVADRMDDPRVEMKHIIEMRQTLEEIKQEQVFGAMRTVNAQLRQRTDP